MTVRTELRTLRATLAPDPGLEYWDATDTPDGRFVCDDHPHLLLSAAELDAHARRTGVDVVSFVNGDPP